MNQAVSTSTDEDGLATVLIDLADAPPVNITSQAVRTALIEAIDSLLNDDDVSGLLITSGKDHFIAGTDLKFIRSFRDRPPEEVQEAFAPYRNMLRRMEKSAKPVVAALPGTALGGGLELCLACNHRIAAQLGAAVFGFPEVTLGLLPGAGGTQRLARLIGVKAALPLLLSGKRCSVDEALALGILDESCSPETLLERAKQWLHQSLEGNTSGTQNWDEQDFTIQAREVAQHQSVRKFKFAEKAILLSVGEGIALPIDKALTIELGEFAKLVVSTSAQNRIQTSFFANKALRKGHYRPKEPAKLICQKIGIVGAGLMGRGIAQVAAIRGIEAVLLDQTKAVATAAIDTIKSQIARDIKKGRLPNNAQDAVQRLQATSSYGDLSDADLIIEAVFEDRELKQEVIKQIGAVVSPNTIIASNTSRLPITSLAKDAPRPARFIGLHFFSPVPRMELLEIIKGRETSTETWAQSIDFALAMGKLPIVVNDGKGFFTSRCFSAFVNEGMRLLAEGAPPALIEEAAVDSGMAVGPLAAADGIGLDIMKRIREQEKRDTQDSFKEQIQLDILTCMVDEFTRFGRKNGQGFYDYDGGKRTGLWEGLGQHFLKPSVCFNAQQIGRRLMYIQSLEACHAMQEGIIDEVDHANVASIMGWSFPAHTGGVVSYIETEGREKFMSCCVEMSRQFGERFLPPDQEI